MSNMLAGLSTDESIKGEDRDVLGGFQLPESGLYDFNVKYAYLHTAKSGAVGVNLVMEREGYEHRETFYVKSGTAKGGNNFYVNQKNEKVFLPGYVTANALCEVVTGKGLAQQTVEDKVLSLYDYDQGKEVPTSVPVLMELVNKPVKAGLIRILENKRAKDQFGNYVDTAETREFMEVDKFFTESGHTLTELKGGAEPAFAAKWAERFNGHVKDKRTVKDGAASAASAPAPGNTSAPVQQGTQTQSAQSASKSPEVDALFG